ncbi:MAG: hypothetical protein IJO28_03360 [Oscillospiraceae bacterium]|nr:hypothetical protein [Oscillospiraceae bacterium]
MKKIRNILLILILSVMFLCFTGCDYIAYKNYYTIDDYTEIWDLTGFDYKYIDLDFIFPAEIENYEVTDFFCRHDEQLPLIEGHQILLEVQFPDEEALAGELERIIPMTTQCSEHFKNSSLDAYAVSLGEVIEDGWSFFEYALVDKNNYKVYFVYLQDLPKKEIEFSHTLLPDDYPVKIPLNPT